jgi:hypothetical protein
MFWNPRKATGATAQPAAPAAAAARTDDPPTKSKVFPKFLNAVAKQPNPILLDLGPVVGPNIEFFGERLACKIVIEDVFSVIERAAVAGDRASLGATLSSQFARDEASVDGILCWDVFDYLDRESGRTFAARLTAILKPGGALYGFFGTTDVELNHYSRVTVEAEDLLRVRPYPATPVRRTVLVIRDVNRMFEGLQVAESVLLKTSARECLFRKP